MYKLTLLLFLTYTFCFAAEQKGLFLTYEKVSSTKVDSLNSNQSVFEFSFYADSIQSETDFTVSYAIDKEEGSINLHGAETLVIQTTPGKHSFQFYLDETHFEITIDELIIDPQFYDVYKIHFENSEFPVIVDKPVIYLYPEMPQTINISPNIHGEDVFEYPEFNNLRNDLQSWKVLADPSGTLRLKGKRLNYLFWEAKQNIQLTNEELKTGFVVNRKDLVSFLEEKLTYFEFNSTEQADFITYWVPRMRKNETVFIHFLRDDECNKFAEYIFDPKPNSFNRMYMIWAPADNSYKVKEQELTAFNRSGFTIVEWGGFEFNINK